MDSPHSKMFFLHILLQTLGGATPLGNRTLPIRWLCFISFSVNLNYLGCNQGLAPHSSKPASGRYSRSSQSSTSISPSVSMSTSTSFALLAVPGGAALGECFASPLCSSWSGLVMAVGPLAAAWPSLGWPGEARVRLGATVGC